ncbi:hypothetical protein JQ607_20275 [Bradyrhizobium liaoningense]|uniref:hypothetical protein n=1 Tax=Bradyrhizobium liaoningense TaxID=43992 RepID=UPI001BADEFBE|nr:hypothetical protein [Bradyrhizobium liaoningense]MBR0842543.1 hypothetical protein [Bradyrhizobium liaoningense]MBR0860124.1 hypothetical protein [Bradyrhizobium liaoningense]
MKVPAGRRDETCCVRALQTVRRDPEAGYAGHRRATKEHFMMDILMLALGFVFFALAIGYTYACERL